MKTKTTQEKSEACAGLAAATCSPRLYEVSVNIRRHAVILATSPEDALEHVEDWEDSWDNHSDRLDISDHEVVDIRDPKASNLKDWKVEAHDITSAARKLLPTGGVATN